MMLIGGILETQYPRYRFEAIDPFRSHHNRCSLLFAANNEVSLTSWHPRVSRALAGSELSVHIACYAWHGALARCRATCLGVSCFH